MIKRGLVIFLSLLVLLLVIAFSLFLYFQPTFYVPASVVDFQLKITEGEVVGWEDGEVRWRLFVEEIEDVKDDYMNFTGGTYGEFYRDGDLEYSITSEKIIYHVKTKQLDFIDAVVLTTVEGDYLTSQRLHWDEDTKELTSPGPVTLYLGENQLQAQRMTVYQEEDIFDFWDQVVLSVPLWGDVKHEGEDEDE